MITLKTVFETLEKEVQATYLCTEDASYAGFLLFRFQIIEELTIVVFYDLRRNEIAKFEALDDFDWDNDQALRDCDSQLELMAFCKDAMKRQLTSLVFCKDAMKRQLKSRRER